MGQYICGDLACPLYVRGKKVSAGTLLDETLDLQARIQRLHKGINVFLDRVTATVDSAA